MLGIGFKKIWSVYIYQLPLYVVMSCYSDWSGVVYLSFRLLKEISECRVSVNRLFIDPCAMLIEQAELTSKSER